MKEFEKCPNQNYRKHTKNTHALEALYSLYRLSYVHHLYTSQTNNSKWNKITKFCFRFWLHINNLVGQNKHTRAHRTNKKTFSHFNLHTIIIYWFWYVVVECGAHEMLWLPIKHIHKNNNQRDISAFFCALLHGNWFHMKYKLQKRWLIDWRYF